MKFYIVFTPLHFMSGKPEVYGIYGNYPDAEATMRACNEALKPEYQNFRIVEA